MTTQTEEKIEARKQLAKETFGRELTTEQVLVLGPRIDAAVRNVSILAEWEERLNQAQTEPSAVYQPRPIESTNQ